MERNSIERREEGFYIIGSHGGKGMVHPHRGH
jgi:hypothetical protein